MSGRTIAWIEDDVDEIRIILKPMIKAGFLVKEYRTYADALSKVEELRSCDLILLDLLIPPGKGQVDEGGYLGRKLLIELRNKYKFSLPIIVFSVVAEASNVFSEEEIKQLNILLVTKPVRPSRLKQEIFKVLGLPMDE